MEKQEKEKLFFTKELLNSVDKNIFTKPIIENLKEFAVNEGLEDGDFKRVEAAQASDTDFMSRDYDGQNKRLRKA